MPSPRIKISDNSEANRQLQKAFDAYSDYLDSLTMLAKSALVHPATGGRILVSRDASGTVLDVDANAIGGTEASEGCPFTWQFTSDGSTITASQLTFGTINAFLPTNTFSAGVPLTLTPITGIKYLKLHVFTDGAAVTDATFVLASTPADPIPVDVNVAPDEFYIDLYAVSVTGTAPNVIATAWRLIGCGNLLATATVVLLTDKALPICAENPDVRHYSWVISTP